MKGSRSLPGHEIQRLLLHDAPELAVAAAPSQRRSNLRPHPPGHAPRPLVRQVLIGFPTAGAGRQFLLGLQPEFSPTAASARLADGDLHLALGFTHAGLERLRMPPPVLAQFKLRAPAFAAGAASRAAEHLGDTGASAAERWDPAFRFGRVHAVLTVNANRRGSVVPLLRKMRVLAHAHAAWLHVIAGAPIGAPAGQQGSWVHFGFRDGLSRLAIDGWDAPDGSHRVSQHAAGEFLLGHRNDHGFNPWLLPTEHEQVRCFFRNGSFGVLRRIEQDVAAFDAWVDARAAWLQRQQGDIGASPIARGAPGGSSWSDYVRAKVCGRWPAGEPVRPPQAAAPDAAVDPAAAFDYAQDPAGEGCPFGAHARRMNPRSIGNSVADRQGKPAAAAPAQVRQRPLVRRGRPYGPMWTPGDKPDGLSRGLIGQFFCSSLEDQFEHLLGHWAERSPLGVDDRGTAKDPLIGHHENPASSFDVPLVGGRPLRLLKLSAFVHTRGTLYAFYPSLPALHLMLENARFYDLPEAPLQP